MKWGRGEKIRNREEVEGKEGLNVGRRQKMEGYSVGGDKK